MTEYLFNIVRASFNLINTASAWIVISYIIAGALHDLIPVEKLHKHLGNKSFSALFKVMVSGVILPICSCGTVPLGISMYYAGAYVGPVLCFMTATPVINPIALILSYGLLGRKITIIYFIIGLTFPVFIGWIANMTSGRELFYALAYGEDGGFRSDMREDKRSVSEKLRSGFNWMINDFALVISKYVVTGMLMAGFIMVSFPSSLIQEYLGNPSALSLINIAVLATVMYVCAVGHIPFIAALIAAGASPGSAVTFLIAGASTNIAELLSIYRMIGKRSAVIYGVLVTVCAVFLGYITNLILLPDYEPQISIDRIDYSIKSANRLMIIFPKEVQYLCTGIILIFFIIAMYYKIMTWKEMRKA